jgi:hypothetical protein
MAKDKNFRYFQFVAGERRGEVVVLDKIVNDESDTFLEFKDGSRMNTDLVAEINVKTLTGKLMAEVESPRNIWRFEEAKSLIDDKPRKEKDWESQTIVEIPSADEIAHADLTGNGGVTRNNPNKKRKINLIPPTPTRNKFGKIANTGDMESESSSTYEQGKKVQQQAPNTSIQASNQPVETPGHTYQNDPVWLMMDKAKKFDTEVEMNLTISLPSKSLYDVASESFDEGGIKVIEYIIHNLDDTKLKNSLRNALFSAYGEKIPEIRERKSENIVSVSGMDLGEPQAVEEPVVGGIVADPSSKVILMDDKKYPLEAESEKLNMTDKNG